MSEIKPVYDMGGNLPSTLEAFKSRPCARAYASGDYISPTPAEISRLIELAGWSQNDVAKLSGVSFNRKGSTTIRKWKTSTELPEHRLIPYAAWRHLLACAGVVSIKDDLKALSQSK